MTINELKTNGSLPIIYDYGFGEFCRIKVIDIYKIKGTNCWLNAKIIDNSFMDERNKPFYVIGSIHSFSNSFLYSNIKAMKLGHEVYKKTQIAFIKKAFNRSK